MPYRDGTIDQTYRKEVYVVAIGFGESRGLSADGVDVDKDTEGMCQTPAR